MTECRHKNNKAMYLVIAAVLSFPAAVSRMPASWRNVDKIPGMTMRRYRNGSHQVRGNARRPFRHARRIQKIANSATVHYSLLPVHYLRCRHYEPMMGRWMSRDPIGEEGGIDVYGWCGNNGVMRTDHLGRKFIKPDKSGQCPFKCCNKKRVRLVPVWSCKRRLKWTDNTVTGPISWYHNVTALYHQYLCCKGPNLDCYGVHAGSKKGDTIPSEPEPTGKCKQLCVCPDEKKNACSGCAKMPEDYHIGPHGTDCQEWVDEVTSSEAE